MYAEEMDDFVPEAWPEESDRPLGPLTPDYARLNSTAGSNVRPITPGGDIVSDELSFAAWNREALRTKKNKQKQRKIARSRLSESVNSSTESPGTAFAETVNRNTGFSPLNPTVPLKQEFSTTVLPSPAPSKPILITTTPPASSKPVQVQTPPVQPRREFLSDPIQPQESSPTAAKPSAAPPTPSISSVAVKPPTTPAWLFAGCFTGKAPAVPSVLPPSPLADTPITPARPSFESVRPELFQKAFLDSIRGVKFDDTDVYLCSKRNKAGVAHKPSAVHARSDFLCAASAVFNDDIYERCVAEVPSVAGRKSSRVEYGYDCDSDLEEGEDEEVAVPAQKRPASRPSLSRPSTTSKAASPKSEVLSATDIDVMSLDDFNSAVSLSDDAGDPAASASKRTTHRPSLSLETDSTVLNWRNEHGKDTAIPIKEKNDATAEAEMQSSPDERVVLELKDVSAGNKTLFVPGSAYRTWQALLLYLYNDHLEFAPLRTQTHVPRPTPDGPWTSPKSMYRLASKLGLDKLREKSFTALQQALSKDNIVEELFSDFTWRYPDVLQMETDVFHRYSSEPSVQGALAEKFQEIAYGQLPHSSVVLSSLFKRFMATSGSRK